MSWTAYVADLLSGRFDARLRESECEELEPYLREIDAVSNNLGAYFLFCLFGSAIRALFLWSSMWALHTSLSFFVLRRQVGQVFMYQYSFTGGVLWISSDRDGRMGAKINTLKNPWNKI